MDYFFLVSSAACSVLIAHLLKLTEVKNLRPLPTLTANYIFAASVAILLSFTGPPIVNLNFATLLFASVTGALFIGNFLLYSKSVDLNGVGVTIAAMRVSLLIPVLFSIYLFREKIGWQTTAGIALVFSALLLLIPKKNKLKIGHFNTGWLLLLIFLLSGFGDTSLKVYQEQFSAHFSEFIFMAMVFCAAFLIGIVTMWLRKAAFFTAKEAGMGCLIGIPNLYSSVFLIYALKGIEGAVAFPIANALNVAAGTALGLLWWNDKISTWQWVGLGIALIAITLLV